MFYRISVFLFLCFFMLLLSFPSQAELATDSDWDELPLEELDQDLINDLEVGNDELLKSILSELVVLRSHLVPDELATPANAQPVSEEGEEMDEELPEVMEYVSEDDSLMALDAAEDSFVNAVRIDATVAGESLVILFPPESLDSLYIDSQGRLFNLSVNTVQGRVVDSVFNPYATSGRLVYLTPCLGNNFNAVYNYGSPNYIRRYYWSSGRLNYSDIYVSIQVDEFHYPFFVSDTLRYVLIFLCAGGVLLLWSRSFKHY